MKAANVYKKFYFQMRLQFCKTGDPMDGIVDKYILHGGPKTPEEARRLYLEKHPPPAPFVWYSVGVAEYSFEPFRRIISVVTTDDHDLSNGDGFIPAKEFFLLCNGKVVFKNSSTASSWGRNVPRWRIDSTTKAYEAACCWMMACPHLPVHIPRDIVLLIARYIIDTRYDRQWFVQWIPHQGAIHDGRQVTAETTVTLTRGDLKRKLPL